MEGLGRWLNSEFVCFEKVPNEGLRAPGGGGTPHYDGARADAAEPAVIAVSGTGAVRQEWVDPSQPVLRRW